MKTGGASEQRVLFNLIVQSKPPDADQRLSLISSSRGHPKKQKLVLPKWWRDT